MNFLAHLYLSGTDHHLMIGNFIADFVKGRGAPGEYPPGVIRGIELHRAIDDFTDRHAVVKQSKNRLRPRYRHYAGVIVDIFYDHYLARQWDQYHAELLPDYADAVYSMLEENKVLLPEAAQWMLPHMIRGNWLANYARIDGIQKALTGMSRRAKFESHMESSTEELQAHYSEFQSEFNTFFPELQQYTQQFLTQAS